MSNVDEQLAELLERWEAALDSGLPLTPEEICRDQPQTLDAFRALLTKIGTINAILVNDAPVEGTAELAGPMHGGRYRVNCFHDKGGQAVIFAADDTELRRTVALKWMPPHSAVDPTERERFVFEAELVAKLEHPGIVPIYGLGTDDHGQPYYAMRMIHGQNLGDVAKAFHSTNHESDAARNLAFRRLLQHFSSVCTTIEYAHARGVLHRDLKPNNVRIGAFGETIVLDWGLAKYLAKAKESPAAVDLEATRIYGTPDAQQNMQRTIPGSILGSPAYMSPEQASGQAATVGTATDIYGLGATLYVLLCGRAPFEGNSLNEVLSRVKAGKFSSPRIVRPSVPQALEAVCLKAMALKPEDRYATVRDLATDIEHWLADEPVAAWREPWPVRARRWISRHRTFASTIAATAVVILAASAIGNVVLERKNHELAQANQTAAANFAQSHESLLNVVDLAVSGSTLSDNAALLPVRLEIVNGAVANARGLLARAPDDRQTTLELMLLLTAQGEMESMLGLDRARESLSEALALGEKLRDDETADARQARALVRYLLAQAPAATGDARRIVLLTQACQELAPLLESQQSGGTAHRFGRRYSPAILLASAVTELPGDSAEHRAWLDLAEKRLSAPPRKDDENELLAQSLRGRMWYVEARRAIDRADLPRARRCYELSQAGVQRSLTAAKDDDFASSIRWFALETEALDARLAALEGRPAEAATALRRVCDDQQALLSTIEAAGADVQDAWRRIAPALVGVGPSRPTDPIAAIKVQLVDHLLELAEIQHLRGVDSTAELGQAELQLAAIEKADDYHRYGALRLAETKVRLAEMFAKTEVDARARRWAEAAVALVGKVAKLDQVEAKAGLSGLMIYQSLAKIVDAEEERLSAAATLRRAYAVLAALAETPAEAEDWRRRAEGLGDLPRLNPGTRMDAEMKN